MIQRFSLLNNNHTALARSRVVTLTGPQQCGKITLTSEFLPENSVNHFDPEDPISMARLSEPMMPSIRIAFDDLKLESIAVIYPGETSGRNCPDSSWKPQ